MEQSVKTHAEFEQKTPLSYQERAQHLQQHGAEVSKKRTVSKQKSSMMEKTTPLTIQWSVIRHDNLILKWPKKTYNNTIKQTRHSIRFQQIWNEGKPT